MAYHIKRNVLFSGSKGLSTEPNYYLVLLIAVLIAPFFFRIAGFYKSYRIQTFYQISMRVSKAVFGIFVGTIFILFLLHEPNVSRMLYVLFILILTSLLLLTKSLLYHTLRHYRSRDYNTRNVLIVGTGQRAKRMIKALIHQHGSGYRIMGCLAPEETSERPVCKFVTDQIKILGSISILSNMLMNEVVDEVIFATDLGRIKCINDHIQFAESQGINIRIVPDFQLEKIMYRPETATVFLQEFAGLPTLAISTIPQRQGELLIKECMDYLGAGVGLLCLSPLFLLIILIVKITSPGSAFFTQERCGLYGRTFKMIKFRTMVKNAENLKKKLEQENEADGPVFKITNDPRITPLGKFLRQTSLDELPQLINVLQGHMSLVGPRPPIPEEVQQYDPWQRRRLSMKPGITCIWQVSGRNNIHFDDWMRLDLDYIDNWSLWLDIKILLWTIKEVASFHGR
jgi:exopolysaccharide biosynthesis polyprenyl glycosylphosphotransferase